MPNRRRVLNRLFITFHFNVFGIALLESISQIELQNMIVANRIEGRKIGIGTAGTQIVIDTIGVPVAESANDVISETVGERREHTFKIAAAFEKIRVGQIDVKRVLLDVLPISAGFPGVFLRSLAINEAEIAET